MRHTLTMMSEAFLRKENVCTIVQSYGQVTGLSFKLLKDLNKDLNKDMN